MIVDEASLIGTFALDELVRAARDARGKVVLIGDGAQLSAIDAGGMFAASVRDRGALAAELTDVPRFVHPWEKTASVELRAGSPDAIDAYESHGRVPQLRTAGYVECSYRLAARPTWVRCRGRAAWPPAP